MHTLVATPATQKAGDQRLSVEELEAWEALRYGMFIHFGMSTFAGEENPNGSQPSTLYAPDKLDVDQWVCIARDAGMKYAVLTAKHAAGHALWPSKHTNYHVGTSGNKTDVVEQFVKACERRGVLPGLYYCSWDNHHRFGSITPTEVCKWPRVQHVQSEEFSWTACYTTSEYHDFQTAQLQELLTQYGNIAEVWIDIPGVLPRDYRNKLYKQIVTWQPQTVVMMNNGISDGSHYRFEYAWPSDIVAIERYLPNSQRGHVKWRDIEGKRYYMPGEVCDPIGREWFYTEGDQPRSDEELLGMYLVANRRGANFLLDVGPDKHGLIPKRYEDALMRLKRNMDKFDL